MRVYVENGIVVCDTESDWKRLPKNEHDFLHDCFLLWEWQKGGNKLQWYQRVTTNNKHEYDYLKQMLRYAKSHEIEVDEEVFEIVNELGKKRQEELEQTLLLEEIKRKRANWEERQKNGCLYCKYCEQVGDAWFRCHYSGDDLTAKFYEMYNPKTQCMELFHEVGVPNAHCKDCFNERETWR